MEVDSASSVTLGEDFLPDAPTNQSMINEDKFRVVMGIEFRHMLKENGGAVQFMMKTLDTTEKRNLFAHWFVPFHESIIL